jgi:hypothetical protein
MAETIVAYYGLDWATAAELREHDVSCFGRSRTS